MNYEAEKVVMHDEENGLTKIYFLFPLHFIFSIEKQSGCVATTVFEHKVWPD
jgi:hypothetical protein